ncbi:hypothetical protein ACLM45_00820 [Synechococcus sp. A10-1-5-9]|uniref:hypothetical protein n=1 Tax=Synechococcus sp. A10-1-5-9 TaxID=3392295 RepID=UPI0039E7D600
MEEWTDAFISSAQQELAAMVKDWQYDYGASDDECAAMLLWMVLRLKPDLNLDPQAFSAAAESATEDRKR